MTDGVDMMELPVVAVTTDTKLVVVDDGVDIVVDTTDGVLVVDVTDGDGNGRASDD